MLKWSGCTSCTATACNECSAEYGYVLSDGKCKRWNYAYYENSYYNGQFLDRCGKKYCSVADSRGGCIEWTNPNCQTYCKQNAANSSIWSCNTKQERPTSAYQTEGRYCYCFY